MGSGGSYARVVEVLEFYAKDYDGGLRARRALKLLSDETPRRGAADSPSRAAGGVAKHLLKEYGRLLGAGVKPTLAPSDLARVRALALRLGVTETKRSITETIRGWRKLRAGKMTVDSILSQVESDGAASSSS